MDNLPFGIGVQCIVLSQKKILLGQRFRIFGNGSWGFPGGRLERGETILQAARRELYEETSLSALDLKIVALSDPTEDNNYHLQIGVFIERWTGDPRILEPQRCSKLGFFSIENLPHPIFVGSNSLLELFIRNSQGNCIGYK